MARYDFVTPDGYKPVREIRAELLNPSSWDGPKLSQDDVDLIMEMFWFRDSYSAFIAKEEVYPKFLEFLKEKNGEPFRRIGFYDYLFSNHPLYEELLQLSYFFEEKMTDRLSLSEYEDLANGETLHIGQLIQEGWLIQEENNYVLSHHTISEYFVAKDILSKDQPIDELSSYAILEVNQTGEKFFNPSWYGVSYFLLETEIAPQLTDFFTELADENKKIIDQNYSEILSHSNLELLSPEQRKKLFNQIYTSAKDSGVWISEWSVAGLVNLYTDESTTILEEDLVDEPDEFPDILKTANVVAVMGELLEENKIRDREVKERWKQIFIKYATQKVGNGVLQRRSLKSLESFEDESIIDQVKSAFDFSTSGMKEKFVQEAFLRLCYAIAPNHPTTIEYIIRGFSSQARAYAWFGLQKVTDHDSLLKFLQHLANNGSVLDLFLDDESVFLKKDEDDQERPFLQHIRELARLEKSEEFLQIASELIVEACDVERYYYIQKHTFIPTLLEIALEIDPSFYSKLLSSEPGERRNRDHLNLVFLLASVTSQDNYQQLLEGVRELKPDLVDRYIYSIPSTAIQTQLREQLDFPALEVRDWDQEEAERKQKVIDDFEHKLEPEPKQYITDVFEYYLRNKEEIDPLTPKQRKRLMFLAYEDGIKRLNPRDFTLKINKYTDGRNFSWSRQAQFYGDMIRVVQALDSDLLQNCKQHLIDFLPFAFSDDSTTINEVIDTVTEEEIEYLNDVFSDPENDRRYLMPSSYIYFVRDMKKKGSAISSPASVLQSFIGEEKISDHDQRSALEVLEVFIDGEADEIKQFLKDTESSDNKAVSEEANALLIKKYQDEESIEWRFSKLRDFALPVRPPVSGEVRTVVFPEDEFIGRSFIAPLVETASPELADKFLELLEFSFEFSNQKDSEQFCEYVNRSVLSYFENIAQKENYEAFLQLEELVSSKDSVFWKSYLSALRTKFLAKGEQWDSP